ncbi:hypothetical protein HPB50_013800 [Hyalomma asiaticum]|uniref:Uncharacterized protein n=1 Tax=Hyalomma asiaticum TaxID=266040 RepID=A0ACB7S2G2_HYAAI|nr:hypothetical protein HPB50_013800 [Hyalomma asiaticum]
MYLTQKAVPTLFLPGEKVSTEEGGREHREVPTTAASVGQSASAASLATKEPASCSTDFEAVQRVASSEPSLLCLSALEPCHNTAVGQTKVLSSSTGAGSSQASSILGLPVVVPEGSSRTGTDATRQILPRPSVSTKSHDVQPSSATPTALTALSGHAEKPSQPTSSSTAPPVVLGHIITLPTLKLISSATGLVGQEAAASSVPVSDMAEQPASGDLTKSGNVRRRSRGYPLTSLHYTQGSALCTEDVSETYSWLSGKGEPQKNKAGWLGPNRLKQP